MALEPAVQVASDNDTITSNIKQYLKGETVVLAFNGEIPLTVDANSSAVICTLTKYLPSYEIYGVVKEAGNGPYSLLVRIKPTNGEVRLYNGTSVAIRYAYGSITYVI